MLRKLIAGIAIAGAVALATGGSSALAAACPSPVLNVYSDTNPSGGGTVSFVWNQTNPALLSFTVEQQQPDGSWVVVRPASLLKSFWMNESFDATYRITTVGGMAGAACSPASAPVVINP